MSKGDRLSANLRKEEQENYIKFRHEDGSFDFLGELITLPPDIRIENLLLLTVPSLAFFGP